MQKVGAQAVEGCTDEALIKMFQTANEACPTRMDSLTTLVEVKLINQRQAEFRYIVNDHGKQLLSRINKRTLKKAAVAHIKGNAMAVAVAQRDLSIEHNYEDSRGSHLLSYTINRAVLEGDLDPVGNERSNPFNATTVKAAAADSVLVKEDETAATAEPVPMKKRTGDNLDGIRGNPFFIET